MATAKSDVKADKKRDRSSEKSTAAFRASDFARSKDIPYHTITVSCACGATYEAGSVLESIRVDICAACHPFFTGESRILDAEGRVDKFRKKYAAKTQ